MLGNRTLVYCDRCQYAAGLHQCTMSVSVLTHAVSCCFVFDFSPFSNALMNQLKVSCGVFHSLTSFITSSAQWVPVLFVLCVCMRMCTRMPTHEEFTFFH